MTYYPGGPAASAAGSASASASRSASSASGGAVSASADGADGILAFDGTAEALTLARTGERQMRLTEFSFEPILPLDASDAAATMTAAELRKLSLELSVERQISRIAKYILRGYEWA